MYGLDERGIILRVSAGARPALWPIQAAMRRVHLKCDSTRTETRFRLSAKRTSPFKSLGALVQSTIVSRGTCMCISGSNGSNAGYTIFQGSVKSTVYLLHSPVSPSLPLPCVTVCHHISTGVYWGKRPGLEDDRPTSFSAKIKHE